MTTRWTQGAGSSSLLWALTNDEIFSRKRLLVSHLFLTFRSVTRGGTNRGTQRREGGSQQVQCLYLVTEYEYLPPASRSLFDGLALMEY